MELIDMYFDQIEELRSEMARRDQELLAMGAKMKTLEEQHQDYQRHIAVLKESLCAKEEHYNMLQTDVRLLQCRRVFTISAHFFFLISDFVYRSCSTCYNFVECDYYFLFIFGAGGGKENNQRVSIQLGDVLKVEELRQRLEEKNRLIEKKTQIALQATQERNRFSAELNEMRDHLDIRDRKINVLQRKVN